jgi:hypothetical protein
MNIVDTHQKRKESLGICSESRVKVRCTVNVTHMYMYMHIRHEMGALRYLWNL